ncbi:hypothetical protein RND81_11G018300 [Saponaria officinalis]|uniref:Pyrrolidone-carboxylate peptidase n=1 Tax=Saponaria officinalis TaxID=3572 RepID=A0AAW1HGW7_SAPOF
MGSEGPKTMTFHVTGFKKFHGVSENPTETIISNLNEYVSKTGLPVRVKIGSCTVLETAGDGAKPALYEMFDTAASNENNDCIVWLHLGVNSGAQNFAIEGQAYNEATFRCPDELGWQPQREAIVADDGDISVTRQTECKVEAIFSFLKKRGFDLMISDDAGRFVCNYVYYHSLRFAKEKGSKSLFVHVPLFSKIDEDTQMRFVVSLLEAISTTC